jgi:hypothetical protein
MPILSLKQMGVHPLNRAIGTPQDGFLNNFFYKAII